VDLNISLSKNIYIYPQLSNFQYIRSSDSQITVVHLLSDISRINFGIWNPVVSTISYFEKLGVSVEIWFPESNSKIPDEIQQHRFRQLNKQNFFLENFPSKNTVFISHGCWSWATRIGYFMKSHGYGWIAVPHGMLEPWSMNQKWFKKQTYFHFIEKRKLNIADTFIAVGGPEVDNLKRWFDKVEHIPNGIEPFIGEMGKWGNGEMSDTVNQEISGSGEQEVPNENPNLQINKSPDTPSYLITFLFLGRLHIKKGVVPLVKAWLDSSLWNDNRFQLIIAGPDEGELDRIKYLLDGVSERQPEGRRSKLEVRSQRVNVKDEKLKTLNETNEQGVASNQSLPPITQDPKPNTQNPNIHIPGPIYGPEKTNLLLKSHFFLLPSQSEGFPTSIIEAMTCGCIPIITDGCNFPEAIEAGVSERIEFNISSIRNKLEEVSTWNNNEIENISIKVKEFVDNHYSLALIARKQYDLILKTIGECL